MNEIIRIAGFNRASTVDGPGVRSVLFFQGCSRRCPGCHNSEINDMKGGFDVSVTEVVDYIKKNCRNKKLTISGGEPLEQLEGLVSLLDSLNKEGFDLCLYTGFKQEFVPVEIVRNLHYLKTGAFKKDATYPPKSFVGSNNQVFQTVRKD